MRRRTALVVVISLLCAQSLFGCDKDVVEPEVPIEDTVVETSSDETSGVDEGETISAEVDMESNPTEASELTEPEAIEPYIPSVPEPTSKFAEYDMLEICIDEIPFTLGDSLNDFISNLSIINYRISANIKNRNLSSGQSLEIPIVAKDNRTVGYLTISNNDNKKHSMKTSPVTSITIIPDSVLSVSAFEINGDTSYEDALFLMGEPDVEELTGLMYKSSIGSLYCTYTANGELNGITVSTKEGVE